MDTHSLTDEQIYWQLVDALGAQVASDGEAHCTCPACSKEAKRGQTHFSFSLRGGKCMVCGQGWGLRSLARQVLGNVPDKYMPKSQRKVPPKRARIFDVDGWERLLGEYGQDGRYDWEAYAPTLSDAVRRERGMTVGTMLAGTSKCRHRRLILPLRVGGTLVGIRSRAIDCDCGKWLSALGTRSVLYNGARLLCPGTPQPDDVGDASGKWRARGTWLWIVENPVDAVLIENQVSGASAVATLGVSMWRDGWTTLVRDCSALGVIVAYDNDAPGNVTPGCAGMIARSWGEEHPSEPPANGNRLVNRLLEAGVKARLFTWPAGTPLKADLGDTLRKKPWKVGT